MRQPSRPKKIFLITVKVLGILSVLAALWWWFFLSPQFQLQRVEIEGTKTVSPDKLRNKVKSFKFLNLPLVERNSLWIIWLRKKKIKEKLISEFLPLKKANIQLELLKDKVKIEVQERKEVGIWINKKNSFYFDQTGFLFRKAPSYEGKIITPVSNPGQNLKLGEKVKPPKVLKSVLALINNQYLQNEINLDRIKVINQNQALKVYFSDGVYALFSISGEKSDFSQSVYVLRQTLEKKVKQDKKDKLKYIDLRIPNRAYIQYKNGKGATSSPEESDN